MKKKEGGMGLEGRKRISQFPPGWPSSSSFGLTLCRRGCHILGDMWKMAHFEGQGRGGPFMQSQFHQADTKFLNTPVYAAVPHRLNYTPPPQKEKINPSCTLPPPPPAASAATHPFGQSTATSEACQGAGVPHPPHASETARGKRDMRGAA